VGTYLVTAPDGRKLKLTGDAPPTEQDLEEIFKTSLTPKKGAVESFVDRGIETAKGLASTAKEVGSAALGFDPETGEMVGTSLAQAKLAKNAISGMYTGAVDAGAAAAARQMPQGSDRSTTYPQAIRAVAASLPVVGPYVMNKVSDIEEGKGAQVAGETAFDALAALAAAKGPAMASAAGRKIAPITKGLKPKLDIAKAVVKEVGKDYIPGVKQYERVKGAINKAEKALNPPPPKPEPLVRGIPKSEFEVEKAHTAAKELDAAIAKRLKVIVKESQKAQTFAEEQAARQARQKQHIADSIAKRDAKTAKNIADGENLEENLRKSVEATKPKPAGDAQKLAEELGKKILELRSKQGLSKGQIRDILEQNHGIPRNFSGQMVSMVLKGQK
jgi:hypothetical protein